MPSPSAPQTCETMAALVPGPTGGAFGYLFGLLHEGTRQRYEQVLQFLTHALAERRVNGFFELEEEKQDYVL